MSAMRAALAAALLLSSRALSSPRRAPAARARACAENICGGGADYPVDGTVFYAEFTVPGLPRNASVLDTGATYFIYTNIFFRSTAPAGLMNQFVRGCLAAPPASPRAVRFYPLSPTSAL